uniref:G-protein coupled receptors family 1 profile domain-containing protein n=1 Tax=Panagrolaimus davidi TaxID=227884 RepID=A0A914QAX0_9BILA
MNETKKFDGAEFDNSKIMSILLPIFDATSLTTFILTIFLILAIQTQTPKSMKGFKTFLLPYSCYTLALEILLGSYCPAVLHPFVYIYPAGLVRYFPPKISAAILALAFYSAISTIDCCIAMTLERYFAMKNMNEKPSKMPSIVFGILTTINFISIILLLIVTQIRPLSDSFIIPYESIGFHISPWISNLEKYMNINLLIIFSDADKNKLPAVLYILVFLASLRVSAAFIFLFLNVKTSKNLKQKISTKLQKHNEMLLRMTYIQLGGFVILIGIPLLGILYVCIFIKEPNFIPTLGFIVMNFFGLYDTLATAICIKPYRIFFIKIFKNRFKYNKSVGVHTQIL